MILTSKHEFVEKNGLQSGSKERGLAHQKFDSADDWLSKSHQCCWNQGELEMGF